MPEKYKVIKPIYKGLQTSANVGDVLIAKTHPNRLWGVKSLMKGNKSVCDLGSMTANECCIKIENK